ncbi:hypothetical protein N9P83_01510 [Flavobacteriaceae bacterium]|jgi:hypothetical protein|nr:hypothetical protein [Flavobacteriaceae bacterium]
MVVGNGLLSSIFKEYKNSDEIIIFASGVSNSSEKREFEFQREKSKLFEVFERNPKKTLIYFSTCAFYDNYFDESPYLIHKRQMEKFIIANVQNYYIFRIPQIIGSKNTNQLLGFLDHKIKNKEEFVLFDIERNLIDFEFLLTVSKYLISNKFYLNKISNIFYPINVKVIDIVSFFEQIHNVKSNHVVKEKKGSLIIEKTINDEILSKLFQVRANYYKDKLVEYYG